MDLFSKKGKLFGLILISAAFISFYLGDITALAASQKAALGISIFVSVLLILIFLFKPKKNEDDLIAEQDERNQYIKLKCAAKAFQTAMYVSFMTILTGMIAFGLTREYAFIWLTIGGILPYGTARLSYLFFSFRYDK